jgi:hypothetical protein
MTTTTALKTGAGTLAETAAGAISDLADKAREQVDSVMGSIGDAVGVEGKAPTRRRRRVLLGAALLGAVAAAVASLRRTRLGRQVEERVIDLTRHEQQPVPEGVGTP